MLEEANGDRYSFSKVFKFQNFLGTGTFGFVVSAIEKATGEVLALKIVDATQQNPMHSLQKEAEILQSLPVHDNVIEYKFLKEYTNYVIMGLEYATGGTLLNLQRGYSHNRKHIKDEDCSKIIKGILLGLKHLHRHDVVHRDLKPSNVVLADADQLGKVKLVDFGLAVKYQTRQGMDETCGTLVYQAPEQMAGGQCYGKAVDVWAAGFIMYELIAGRHPLWERGDSNVVYKAKALNFTKHKYGRRFNKLSQGLLEKLCHPKPSLRYTVDQALQHPWITRNFQGEIPRNHFEQSMYLNDTDDKFRKMINLVFTLSVIKNQELVQANKSMRLQIMQEKTAQPTKDGSSDLANERSSSALSKIKSCDDIKSDMNKDKEKQASEGSDDGSFNRQITPFFQQNTKAKAKEIEEQFGSKRASQISQRTDASKFDAMDSYLIGNIDNQNQMPSMDRNKNKKMLEVNIEINSKKGKIRMDTSIGETSGFKSDLTPRDRGIGEGYSQMTGFATRNLPKPKQTDSFNLQAADQSVIKSIASKNLGGNSIGSKPSSQRSLISLKQINSTSNDGVQVQANKPPLGEASGSKQHGQKDNSRIQRSFRIGKFQTKKQLDNSDKAGLGMSPAAVRSGSGDVNQSQDMGEADEPTTPLKSSLLEPRVQSIGSSTHEVEANMSLASPRINAGNTRNLLLLSQDIQEPVESGGFESLIPIVKEGQNTYDDIKNKPYQQTTEKKEYRRKLVSSNAFSDQNKSQQEAGKSSKVMLSDEKIDELQPKSKSKSDNNVKSNSKTNPRLKESASGSDFDRSGNEGTEPLVFKRTVEGQFTPVKVNIREVKKKKVIQTTSKKDRVNKNPNRVRVQTQIKRLSSKQGTIITLPEGQVDFGKEQAPNILQSPELNENKQLGDCESSRTQSTPMLLTNDNSMLEEPLNNMNISSQHNNYNQASVKFKRKLTKAGNTPKTVNEAGNEESNPSSPMLQQPILGLEREQGSSFNSKSELRQGQQTMEQVQNPLQKQYAKSQLNEFAAQMKNRSSSFIEKNRNIIQNGYPTQLSNMQQQMAQTGGMSNPLKLSQMKSEIMTNQQKFRLSMNSQIPKNGNNKSQVQNKQNGAYYNNTNYEIIKHDGPALPNPRGAQGSPSQYVNALPIRGLERFTGLAQPYAFKENGELKDNALTQFVQYQQYKVGPSHKGSTGSTRIQSQKGAQLSASSGPPATYKSGQPGQPLVSQPQLLSKSPMLMSNFKLITEAGPPMVFPTNSVYPAQQAASGTSQLQITSENAPNRQQSSKTSSKPEGGKPESGADFSPFESFLLNLLQKNNDDQQQQTQGPEPGQLVTVIGKQKPIPTVVGHNTYSNNNIPAKRQSSQSESRNTQPSQGGSEAALDKNRAATLKKGTIGISNINFKF